MRFIHVIGLAVAILLGTALSVIAEEPVETSMVQLLAHPDKYHGKLVRVSGYLHVKFEDNCLYLSKDDADHLNGKQGFWASFAESAQLQPKQGLNKFDCQFVLVEGVFDKDRHGHLGAAAGHIDRISRVLVETRWYDGKKELQK